MKVDFIFHHISIFFAAMVYYLNNFICFGGVNYCRIISKRILNAFPKNPSQFVDSNLISILKILIENYAREPVLFHSFIVVLKWMFSFLVSLFLFFHFSSRFSSYTKKKCPVEFVDHGKSNNFTKRGRNACL